MINIFIFWFNITDTHTVVLGYEKDASIAEE